MTITIKINKRLKVQKYKNNGLRIYIYLKFNNFKKWISLKLTEKEIQLLRFIIKIINE